MELFYKQGVEKTTMRDIAAACGISTGNLTYYYHKKEDLLAVVHRVLLEREFEQYMIHFKGSANPWISFIAVNHAHLSLIAAVKSNLSGFLYATQFPPTREEYVSASTDLLYQCLCNTPYEKDKKQVQLASIVGCGGEFVAMETLVFHRDEFRFEELIAPAYTARMYQLNVPNDEMLNILQTGIKKGQQLFNSLPNTSVYNAFNE